MSKVGWLWLSSVSGVWGSFLYLVAMATESSYRCPPVTNNMRARLALHLSMSVRVGKEGTNTERSCVVLRKSRQSGKQVQAADGPALLDAPGLPAQSCSCYKPLPGGRGLCEHKVVLLTPLPICTGGFKMQGTWLYLTWVTNKDSL